MTKEEIARSLHNRYEAIAKEIGWKTQESCQVDFNLLPEKNKKVMLKLAEWINDREEYVRKNYEEKIRTIKHIVFSELLPTPVLERLRQKLDRIGK